MEPSLPESIADFLTKAVQSGSSDIHFSCDEYPRIRLDGQLVLAPWQADQPIVFTEENAQEVVDSLLSNAQKEKLQQRGSLDSAVSTRDGNRFRFNVYRRSGKICFSFRNLPSEIPSLSELGLDSQLYKLCDLKDGLVLVAGPTGSGKSTTIASLVDRVNSTRRSHIITIEDPVEYLHQSKESLVNQRHVGEDVPDFHSALKDALRQDPDVLLVGELRDIETIKTAITAAETGHLVFASVHSGDCKGAVERLISAYSPQEQDLACRLVATVLRSVIVQHLLPVMPIPEGGAEVPAEEGRPRRVVASEVMYVNSAISNLIATSNLSQMATMLQTSAGQGMVTLDESLASLWRRRLISQNTARSLARNPELLSTLARKSRK